MRKNILIFAPFGSWRVHHQLDAVIGAALRLRGCTVNALCCDGVFKNCYIAGNPYNPRICARCAQAGEALFKSFNIPVLTLRDFFSEEERRACADWAYSVSAKDFSAASFEGASLGRWTALGMNLYYKSSQIDFSIPAVEEMNRHLLYNGALIKKAYEKVIGNFAPDYVLCYNGGHIYYRIVYELSKKYNIETLTHERGWTDDSFLLLNNATPYTVYAEGIKEWENWQNVPLKRDQLAAIRKSMSDRETGSGTNFIPVYDFTNDERAIRHQLRIPPAASMIVLFASNDWEAQLFESYGGITKLFKDQKEWIRATAALCAGWGHYLVVRQHPICAGKKNYPRATQFLQEMIQLNRELGDHVRVIMPAEKITSYSLIWNADAAVTMFSTIGSEALMRGVATVCVADSHFAPMGMESVRDIGSYGQALQKALQQTQQFGIENLRKAYRYAYFLTYTAYSHKFKSFGIRETYQMDVRLKNIAELSEDADPVLDRVCNHVMYGTPLYNVPEHQESIEEETAFLEEELQRIKRRRGEIQEYVALQKTDPEPLVTVIRVRRDGTRNQNNTLLAKSLEQSWHKNIEYAEIPLRPATDGAVFLDSLADAVTRAQGEFVYIASDNLQLNASLFAACSDLLSSPENAYAAGILFGAYVCSTQEKLIDEFFTELNPAHNFADAVNLSPLFLDPCNLLSLFFLRKKGMQNIIGDLMRQKKDWSLAALSEELFTRLCSNPRKLHELSVPLLVFYEEKTTAEIVSASVAFLQQGKAAEALAALDHAKATGIASSELQYCRALAKIKLGRLVEARLTLASVLLANPAYEAAWRLFDDTLRCCMQSPYTYAAISDAVEDIEGYLVAGQEKYLFDKVRSLPHNAIILEIGGCYGRSTVAMAFACVGTERRIFTIDTFYGNDGVMGRTECFLDIWHNSLSRFDLEGYAVPLPGLSAEVLSAWADKPRPDFVFIDGSHEYADVIKDFELVYPLVKEGGYIALHDVEPGWPGPWRVWRQTACKLLAGHETCRTLACGRKVPGRPYQSFSQIPYSYARDWAIYLAESSSPALAEISKAMLIVYQGFHSASGNKGFEEACHVIAHMPDKCRRTLRAMISKEASRDGMLHYWNFLTLLREGKESEALREQKQAEQLLSMTETGGMAASA